jgi:hypothetical protein
MTMCIYNYNTISKNRIHDWVGIGKVYFLFLLNSLYLEARQWEIRSIEHLLTLVSISLHR